MKIIKVEYNDKYIGDNQETYFIKPSEERQCEIFTSLNVNDVNCKKVPKVCITIYDTENQTYVFNEDLALG